MSNKSEKKIEDYFKISRHKLPYWDELPEIDLYMDQVIALMDKYLSFHKTEEDKHIVTHSMINNYVKLGVMPAPIKKKYSREHIAYLIIICSLKQALPIQDIKRFVDKRVKNTSIGETLNFYSDLYDSVFNTVLAIGKKFSNKASDKDSDFSDTALFMAIGSNFSRYVSIQIAHLDENLENDKKTKNK